MAVRATSGAVVWKATMTRKNDRLKHYIAVKSTSVSHDDTSETTVRRNIVGRQEYHGAQKSVSEEWKSLPLDPQFVEDQRRFHKSIMILAETFRSQAETFRSQLIHIYGCDPKGIAGRFPFFFSKKDNFFCLLLHRWDYIDRIATRFHEVGKRVASIDSTDALLGVRNSLLEMVDHLPLLMKDRIHHPLFPQQRELVLNDLCGLIAAHSTIGAKTRLYRALSDEDESVHNAFLDNLPGAVMLKTRGWIWHEQVFEDTNNGDNQSLKDICNAVANIIAGPERKAEKREAASSRSQRRMIPDDPMTFVDDLIALRDCYEHAGMTDLEAETWRLREIENVASNEIAAARGVKDSAVRTMNSRAKEKFRTARLERGYSED